MIRLFHVSDIHFGAEDAAALDWFAALVRDEQPDAVIMTGDLTMRARAREFEAARSATTICPTSTCGRACSRRIGGIARWSG